MKKIISGMLICTVLLNSFSVIASGEELVKTETTGETGLVTQATSETTTNSTEDTSSVTEENTSERDSSASSTKEESLDSSTNSTTEEHSSVSETNTTDSKTEASQSSEVEKKTIDQDEADYQEAAREGTNHKKGTYAMKNGISSRVARATVANVYANDPNLPGKNFIDVSSWNGDISVAEYQKIKSYGVTGVSVKLTEGTWYVNPYAAGQIRNAKAAGLKVSAYHYSMYVSAATAQDEARYFAQAAANSGLDKNTIMFNDAEDPTLTNNGRNAHANSVAFNQQLKALGYKNDALYVGKWWLTAGYIDTSAFGRDRVWVAQYPYTPDSSMQWNNDHGAWQWSSQMYFPGLANYEGRPFDISMTYSNFLDMGNSSSGPDLSKYYTTNPGRVVVMKDETFYNNADFTSKGAAVKKNTLVEVQGIEYSSTGYPRLVTPQGYLTARKDIVLAAISNIDKYYTVNPGRVVVMKDETFYNNADFTSKGAAVKKNTLVEVQGIEYSSTGYPRLVTPQGYLTARKDIVLAAISNIDKYYTANPGRVVVMKDETFYNNADFTSKGAAVKKNTLVEVQGIEYSSTGYPRLVTPQGYLTARKDIVLAAISNIDKYYTANPGRVVVMKDETFYNNADFTSKGAAVKKNTLVEVQGIEYSSTGYPRLVTPQGYLTARKDIVLAAISNIDKYYTVNPGRVVVMKDETFYNNADFTSKGAAVKKNTLVEVQGIEYSSNGYPRLVTRKGYLTARKDIVSAAISNIDNYYTENPVKIVMLVNDRYYTDLEFKTPGSPVKKGTTIRVQGIEYSKNGYPRLKTPQGYITSNKRYVQKVN
ncbi:GH25 family lysozyme M1 (1,4-beta-N-acetylmuramidase) [Enterococcus faecalis]|uniref:DUF5776 domain-containing protein n=1 Tax=Enterococcus sp. DIV1315a TaxID=2774695 RepID=UPI001A044967|nr:glycosyl hydrolase family 25 [Enterococcus faecalis]